LSTEQQFLLKKLEDIAGLKEIDDIENADTVEEIAMAMFQKVEENFEAGELEEIDEFQNFEKVVEVTTGINDSEVEKVKDLLEVQEHKEINEMKTGMTNSELEKGEKEGVTVQDSEASNVENIEKIAAEFADYAEAWEDEKAKKIKKVKESLKSKSQNRNRRKKKTRKKSSKFLGDSSSINVDDQDEGRELNCDDEAPKAFDFTTNLLVSNFSRGMFAMTSSSSNNFLKDSYLDQSVNFPASYIKSAMSEAAVDECLLRGIRVEKVTTYGKFKTRILTISQDRFAIFCTHRKVRTKGDGGLQSAIARRLPLPLFSRKGIRGFTNSSFRDLYVRYIDISDIDHIEVGYPCSRKFESSRRVTRRMGRLDRVDILKDRIISIYHHGGQTLDIIASSNKKCQLLFSAISNALNKYHNAELYVVDEARLLRYIWYDVDKNNDGTVSEKEFEIIANRINLSTSFPRQAYQSFCEDLGISSNLTYLQCMRLLAEIKQGRYESPGWLSSLIPSTLVDGLPVTKRLPHMELWDNIFDGDYVSARDFLSKFLHAIQKEVDATTRDVKVLFSTFNKMEVNWEVTLPIRQNYLSRHRFSIYLPHIFNVAFDPDAMALNPELMTRPITEYWINSSHNTYLTGDQLQSISSVEMYRLSLRRGCKCLELDCWDGERDRHTNKPIPIIYHGGTLTSRIWFEDVIICVAQYTKENPNTYPIILSLENHCSEPFQEAMVESIRRILKDTLYIPFARDATETIDENDILPSPAQLIGKVIIKGKRTSLCSPCSEEIKEIPSLENLDEDEDEENNRTSLVESAKSTNVNRMNPTGTHHGMTIAELEEITLFHGCKFKSWERSIISPPSHMHSIGETKTNILIQKYGASKWRKYNQEHMTRIYPAGTRIDSSNYIPILAWSMGCQLVALNFQTADTAMFLNDGRFLQNGNCGYVLKPQGLHNGPMSNPLKLNIRILSGSCIPKADGANQGENVDPYVKIITHDVISNSEGQEVYTSDSERTGVVDNNGFHPIWNEQKYHEFNVFSPYVAMIQFAVWESNKFAMWDSTTVLDNLIAVAAIPIACLRQGYRSILLRDKNGTRTGAYGCATLLVEIRCQFSAS
jgi:phosphatidylinositol phospholipase C, delta